MRGLRYVLDLPTLENAMAKLYIQGNSEGGVKTEPRIRQGMRTLHTFMTEEWEPTWADPTRPGGSAQ